MIAVMSLNDTIERALNTSSMDEIAKFVKSPYMLVRRALAKNRNVPVDLINRLCMDPVLNVSYIASKHPKSSTRREFDEEKISPCVTCKLQENKLNCTSGCKRKEDHSF